MAAHPSRRGARTCVRKPAEAREVATSTQAQTATTRASPPSRAQLRAPQRERRSRARNIASVPWRWGQSWTVPGRGPGAVAARSVHVRGRWWRRAPRLRGVRRRARRARPRRRRRSRRARASTSRRPRRHRGAPSRAPRTSRARCSGTSRSTSSGTRRQRASGRRRSAPRPVHGASTSTRSKASGRHAGRVPSAVTTPSSPSPAARTGSVAEATSRARCSWSSAASSRAPRAPASAASSAALPPGPGAQVEPPLVRPVDGRGGEGERDDLRPLVLHARAALGHGRELARVAARQRRRRGARAASARRRPRPARRPRRGRAGRRA